MHWADERGLGKKREKTPKVRKAKKGGRAPAGNRGYLQRRPRFAVRLRLEGPATRIAAPPSALGHPGEALAGESPSLLC